MTRHGPADSEVLVFTYKEGLLSSIAHDLKLKVTRFSLEATQESVTASFEADSLRVLCAMKNGQEAPGALPGFASAEIEKAIAKTVLAAAAFPAIRFESTRISENEVMGRLTLHGITREIRGARRDESRNWTAEFRIDQQDFGIRPYSAMLGTLKVRPEVLVRVSIQKV